MTSSVGLAGLLLQPTPAPRMAKGLSDDRELILRAQAGERMAFVTLYRTHQPMVTRRLSRLIGPDADLEDLVQQVFSEVFAKLDRYRGQSRFSTYLCSVANNMAYDFLRRRSRHRARFKMELPTERASDEPTPETTAMNRHQLARAWRYLDRIKPKKRIALILRLVEGLTLEEIAEQVGARPSAVGKRIEHARRELLAMIERDEGIVR